MTKRGAARIVIAAVAVAVAVSCIGAATFVSPARAGTLTMTACSGYGDAGASSDDLGAVWAGVGNGSFSTANRCGQGGSFQILPAGFPKRGDSVQWHTITPPSIEIVNALTPVNEVLIDPNSGDGFNASFFWNGGTQTIVSENNCCGGMHYGSGINRGLGPSRYFGWQVSCQASTCGQPLQILDVRGVDLTAVDNTAPSVVALGQNNVWYQSQRWIRGAGWPASFEASDDSGVCSMRALIGGTPVQGPYDLTPDQHSWTQCPTPETQSLTLDTTQYPDGPLSLALWASDAAYPANLTSPSETLRVDNTPVTLSLTGPADALSTAGTQYVAATAGAGPSGVAGIHCTVDGAQESFAGASARIPIAGVGSHTASCQAQNNAIDPAGAVASSPTETFSMTIRQPTVAAITFARIVDRLRCHRRLVRVAGPLRVVVLHGRTVKLHAPGHTRWVTRCHARTVRRRVLVLVHRHGKLVKVKKVRRVVVLPHTVFRQTIRVAHGRRTTVSGYLGLADGAALGGRTVEVTAAVDNGLGRFRTLATVTTAANGTWSARVGAGPSRLIEALYAGDGTTEPASSVPVTETVPARVKLLSVTPRVPWGGTVRIVGQLRGGYLPATGALVRMRIGEGRAQSTFGVVQHVTGNGRFATTYTFGAGIATVHQRFWLSAQLLATGNYPYASATSRRRYVLVGGHPKPPPPSVAQRRHRKHKRHRAKHRKR